MSGYTTAIRKQWEDASALLIFVYKWCLCVYLRWLTHYSLLYLSICSLCSVLWSSVVVVIGGFKEWRWTKKCHQSPQYQRHVSLLWPSSTTLLVFAARVKTSANSARRRAQGNPYWILMSKKDLACWKYVESGVRSGNSELRWIANTKLPAINNQYGSMAKSKKKGDASKITTTRSKRVAKASHDNQQSN